MMTCPGRAERATVSVADSTYAISGSRVFDKGVGTAIEIASISPSRFASVVASNGPFLISEIGKARLEMQGQRVVHCAADLASIQVLLQVVAALDTNGVLVEDRDVLGVDEGRLYLG